MRNLGGHASATSSKHGFRFDNAHAPAEARPMKYAIGTLSIACLAAATVGCKTLDAEETTNARCSTAAPTAFPYQPECCDYQVDIPDDTEGGFDSPNLGADPSPDHLHVGWAGPTDSTFAVNWRTDNDTTTSQLLYASSREELDLADGPGGSVERVSGHHILFSGLLDGDVKTRVHEAHVCGLNASTDYYYKVGGPGAWSDVFDVTTGPAVGSTDDYRFAVLGDSRNDAELYAQVQRAVADHDVAFQLFTGDAVNIGFRQQDWNDWFESVTDAFKTEAEVARTPLILANGNHENLATNYLAQFTLPQEITEGEGAQGEEWFSFDFANARFVVLNDTPVSRATSGPQLAWLEATLASVDREQTPWIFVMHHRPPYSCGGAHGSDLDLRATLQPLLDKYEVDIVLNGHDHLYERSKPIRGLKDGEAIVATDVGPNDTPVSQSGTLYVVAGGAGAPLYGAQSECNHTYVAESVNNYSIVDIADRTLRLTTYRLDGTVIDQFEFTK